MRNGLTLLVLGGKPIGSCELVEYAHARGDQVIVADYLPVEQSPAKLIADDHWEISTADIERLAEKCKERKVDGVLTGVHEFNIVMMAKLCMLLDLPCYCTEEQQLCCIDKKTFKDACSHMGIPVAREYQVDGVSTIRKDQFPLAVKPKDGSGSRGFSKCQTNEEVLPAVKKAREFSASGDVLIEEFIDADAVIIHYTAHQGKIEYSGIADKHSEKMGDEGSPIMALQIAPSIHEAEYLAELNSKAIAMLASLNITEGPAWIEAFHSQDGFVFNEMGYRFGGSLSYHLVNELYGIDQLELRYNHAMGIEAPNFEPLPHKGKLHAIWPLHVRAGTISSLVGFESLADDERLAALVKVHTAGDEIESWGSAQQVLAYLHITCESAQNIVNFMQEALKRLHAFDQDGNDMLYSLFDPSDTESQKVEYPSFLRQHLQLAQGEVR